MGGYENAFQILMMWNLLLHGPYRPGRHSHGATCLPAPRLMRRRCFKCDEANSGFCAEVFDVNYEGKYIGHDEPALLFYSNVPGSGNSSIYRLTLPKDPPTLPNQAGTGGVFNFQLHSTLWLGMVLCDTESSPEYTKTCVPNTDANIFDSADPNAPDFIGHHPGSAYLEVQFYPPGWVSPCFDPTHWCAALTLSSNNVNQLTGEQNNADCLNRVGSQPGNLAFITKNGIPIAPGNPLRRQFRHLPFRSQQHPQVQFGRQAGGRDPRLSAGGAGEDPRPDDRPLGLDDGRRLDGLRAGHLRPQRHDLPGPALRFPSDVQHLRRAHPDDLDGAFVQRRLLGRDRPLRALRSGRRRGQLHPSRAPTSRAAGWTTTTRSATRRPSPSCRHRWCRSAAA